MTFLPATQKDMKGSKFANIFSTFSTLQTVASAVRMRVLYASVQYLGAGSSESSDSRQ